MTLPRLLLIVSTLACSTSCYAVQATTGHIVESGDRVRLAAGESARRDLPCPREPLRAHEIATGRHGAELIYVEGCGRRATYVIEQRAFERVQRLLLLAIITVDPPAPT